MNHDVPRATEHRVTPLDEADARLIRFERAHLAAGRAKDDAIRAELGLSPVQYFHRLAELRSDERAIAADPILMGRLTKAHEERMRARRARREAVTPEQHRKRDQ